MALVVKNPSAKAGVARDMGLIPRLGRSPREGSDNLLQYSYLENSMGREAWWPHTVHGAKKSWTQMNKINKNFTSFKVFFFLKQQKI